MEVLKIWARSAAVLEWRNLHGSLKVGSGSDSGHGIIDGRTRGEKNYYRLVEGEEGATHILRGLCVFFLPSCFHIRFSFFLHIMTSQSSIYQSFCYLCTIDGSYFSIRTDFSHQIH